MANFEVFYTVLKDIHSEFDKKRQSVQFDTELSQEGKAKRLAKIDENRQKAVTQLQETFTKEYDKQLAILDKKLNVSKESPVAKAREHLQGELVKSVNLGNLSPQYLTLDDNNRTQLILDAIESTHRERMDLARQQAYAQGDENFYRRQLQQGLANKDIDKVEALHKSLDLKTDDYTDRLRPEYESAIRQIKNELMSDEQRQALNTKQTLEHDKELLDYSFTNVSQRNEYVDARNAGKETPVNELKLVRPNIHRQFAQNKTNT